MRVCFETFGCRLNKAEALQMEAEFVAAGWTTTSSHSDADLIVIRGCSVTRRAQYECERMIAHLRHRYPTKTLKICGCIPKDKKARKSSALTVRSRAAGVDAAVPASETGASGRGNGSGPSPIPTRTARAYLKVQDGCSGKCTFCIVPQFRGDSVSTEWDSVLDKAKRFIEVGYHEIVVTGCNLSLYASRGRRLSDLVAALASLSPDVRIRLGSLEPSPCALEVVHAIAEHANVCRFLHIPVQSGSNRVLHAMRRPYDLHEADELADSAVRLMPQIGLGCDIMTGFPGEEDFDFSATKSLLRRHPFNNVHVFPYSERPDTVAAGMFGVIPKEVRAARALEVSEIVRLNRNRFAQSFVGKTVDVVVEGKTTCRGWTSEYLACTALGTATRKHMVKILVTNAKDDVLTGKLLTKPT